MSTWLIPREELTPEQVRAIELDPAQHRVIVGPPGSGKTQILLHRARYLMDEWNVHQERFHIFVFTKVLKDYIRSALDFLSLPQESISNVDAWYSGFFRTHIGGRLPWNPKEKRPDFPAIRQAVMNKIQTTSQSASIYDFILVDEGQDLEPEIFDMFWRIAKHITVCLDHKQQIYDHGSSESAILRGLRLKKRNINFLEAFRCCPYIVNLAAAFIEDVEERGSFIRQIRTYQTERETPLLYCASDFDDEKRRLIEIVRIRLGKGERIAILLPQNRQVFGFAKGLREAGLEVETPDKLDFSNNTPKLMAYHSGKGLTFDSVLMPRLTPRSFPKINQERINHLLFVGITRATKWVYMSTNQSFKLLSSERIHLLESQGVLTVQYGVLPLFRTDDGSQEDDIPAEGKSEPLDIL